MSTKVDGIEGVEVVGVTVEVLVESTVQKGGRRGVFSFCTMVVTSTFLVFDLRGIMGGIILSSIDLDNDPDSNGDCNPDDNDDGNGDGDGDGNDGDVDGDETWVNTAK